LSAGAAMTPAFNEAIEGGDISWVDCVKNNLVQQESWECRRM
jgi:hypothetical protein